MSNCTHIDDLLERYYLSTFYVIEFCVGFSGNVFVILGYIFCLPKWQSCNIYLFSLAVSDLIFLCTFPRLTHLYIYDQPETVPYACVINRYVLHVNLYSSILFMVWLSMDRFLLIKHPTRDHVLLKPHSAVMVTSLSWCTVNVEVAPMIALMVQDLKSRNSSQCKDFASLQGDIDNLSYSLGLTVFGFILPLFGLCLFSYKISHLLHVQDKILSSRTISYKRPLKVVTSVAVIFLVLYTPYHVMRNVRIASQKPWARLEPCTKMYINAMYILTRPLAFLHSVVNPIFYFLMGDNFRKLLLVKFRQLQKKTEQHSEPT